MKKGNPLMQFMIGLIMLVAGGYWFMTSVTVTTGFYGLTFGDFRINGGLVVVPFIAGIIWIFISDSIGGKILTVLGLVAIIASVIMSTHFVFERRTLYEYLIMLVLIFGGAGLCMKVLFAKPKGYNDDYVRELERDVDKDMR